MEWLEESDLTEWDYVEYAVAIEEMFLEKGISDVSYQALDKVTEELIKKGNREEILGMEILVIERKVQKGFNLRIFTMAENVRNDKLSLLLYR